MKLKRTWIAISCVALAVIVSQLYSMARRKDAERAQVSVVSEVHPTNSPAPLPAVKSVVQPARNVPENSPVPTNAPSAKPQATPSPSPSSVQLPTDGAVTTPFSDKELIYFPKLSEWRCHLGTDFAPGQTDEVSAIANGKVLRIYEDYLYGTTVVISHDGEITARYCSLKDTAVSEGDTVSAGTLVGHMGATASCEENVHLHLEIEKGGKKIDLLPQIA